MSRTSPTQLSYDVFVSDGPARARRRAHAGRSPAGVVAAVVDADLRAAGRRPGGPALHPHPDRSIHHSRGAALTTAG